MSTVQIGPWRHGYANAVPLTRIPGTSLSDAVNVDIDRAGSITRRHAYGQIDAVRSHSLHWYAGKTYGVVGSELGELTESSFMPLATVAGPLSWTELNAELVFSDGQTVAVIRNGTVQSLTTTQKPDEAELSLAPLPAGRFIQAWSGRLLSARGSTLYFSEPLRYGLYDRLRGFVRFESRIHWVAGINDGVFVGLRDSVRWLNGTNPHEWQQVRVGAESWQGAAAVLTTEHFDENIGASRVALWFTPEGFAIGLSGGQVVMPQKSIVKDVPMGSGRMYVRGDRVIVLGD